jgi:hypothetical protein
MSRGFEKVFEKSGGRAAAAFVLVVNSINFGRVELTQF